MDGERLGEDTNKQIKDYKILGEGGTHITPDDK